MHSSFSCPEENDILLDEMVLGRGVVGLRFAKSERPSGSIFFKSLTQAEPIIRATLADMEVNGCWVACHLLLDEDMQALLIDINKSRPLSGMRSGSGGWNSYDLL